MALLRYWERPEEVPPIPGFLSEEESWLGSAMQCMVQVAVATAVVTTQLAALGSGIYQQVEEIPTAPPVTIVEEVDYQPAAVRLIPVLYEYEQTEAIPTAPPVTVVEEVEYQPTAILRITVGSSWYDQAEEIPTAVVVVVEEVEQPLSSAVRWMLPFQPGAQEEWFVPTAGLMEEDGALWSATVRWVWFSPGIMMVEEGEVLIQVVVGAGWGPLLSDGRNRLVVGA